MDTLLYIMGFQLPVCLVILICPDKEESLTVFVGINAGHIVNVLNGILLTVVEIDGDFGIAIEQGGIVMRPAVDMPVAGSHTIAVSD